MFVKYLNEILSITLCGVTSLCPPVKDSYTINLPTHINLNESGSFNVSLDDCSLQDDDSISINFDDSFLLKDEHGKDDIYGYIENPNIVFDQQNSNTKTINYYINDASVGNWSGQLNVNISLNQKDEVKESNVLLPGKKVNEILVSLNPTTITFSHTSQDGEYLYDLSEAQDESILLYQKGVAITITNGVDKPIILNKDSSNLFAELKVTKINNISYLDTSRCESMSRMFSSCSKITSLDLSSFNTSNCKSMAYMFDNMSALKSLKGLENFDVGNVENLSHLLNGNKKLQAIPDLTGWNVSSKCTNMDSMFRCIGYTDGVNGSSKWPTTQIDYSGWDVSGVTNMSFMFMNAFMLTNLNIQGWNTSNVVDMEGMFMMYDTADRSRLETIVGIESIDVSNVTNMKNMFYSCLNFNADFSNWNPSSVADLSTAFYDTRRLDITGFESWSDKLNFDNLDYTDCFGLYAGLYVSEDYRPSWYQ